MDFERHVLKELSALRRDITYVRIEIAKLKVKSGIWGLVGASIPVCILFLREWILKG